MTKLFLKHQVLNFSKFDSVINYFFLSGDNSLKQNAKGKLEFGKNNCFVRRNSDF